MEGQFNGNVQTDDSLPDLNQILTQFKQASELDNEVPRLRVEITKENIDNKVNCVKDFLKTNPNSTIKNIKKALLDTGFNLINDEEVSRVIKDASIDKYNELYPTVSKSTPKSCKCEVLTLEQRKFLIDNCNYDNKTLFKMFNKEFPNTGRKESMIYGFFHNGAGMMVKRNIGVTTPIPKNTTEIVGGMFTKEEEDVILPEFKKILDNNSSISNHITRIYALYKKSFPQSKRPMQSIKDKFYPYRREYSKVKPLIPAHDSDINKSINNSSSNNHVLAKAITALYKSGKSPKVFSEIKPVIELISDPNEVDFAIECLIS